MGAEWAAEKIEQPRLFTYWREPQLRSALYNGGWGVLEVVHSPGRRADWLLVIARRSAALPASSEVVCEAGPRARPRLRTL